jgi:hypothetical protein
MAVQLTEISYLTRLIGRILHLPDRACVKFFLVTWISRRKTRPAPNPGGRQDAADILADTSPRVAPSLRSDGLPAAVVHQPALLLVPRVRIEGPVDSRLRPYWRVATPTSICSTTRRLSGSVSANAAKVGNATSAPPDRTRGRRICTCRPASTTSLAPVPARDVWRSD